MNINQTDKWFSIFIRLRDSDEYGYCKCFTCNNVYFWKSMDCGHWIKRQHQGARYHEYNAHAQCKVCNWHLQGNDSVYEKKIIELYGQQQRDLLKSAERHTTKHSKLELKTMTEDFKRRALKLADDKGLKI